MFIAGGPSIALSDCMVSAGAILLIVGLNGLGSGAHLVPPPQTEMDVQDFTYLASEVDTYESYLKMIPTQMQSAQESNQVQVQFLSHAVSQFQNLVQRKLESLPAVQRLRDLPNTWLKSAQSTDPEPSVSSLSSTKPEVLDSADPEIDRAPGAIVAGAGSVATEPLVHHAFNMDFNPAVTQARMKYTGYLDANASYAGLMQQLELGISKTIGSTKISFDHFVQLDTRSMVRMSWNW
jgi:hypothetical protein